MGVRRKYQETIIHGEEFLEDTGNKSLQPLTYMF